MGGDGGSCDTKRVLKTLFGAFVIVVFMWLLLIGISADPESKGGGVATVSSPGSLRHVMLVGSKKHFVPENPKLVNVSKRRVPSGPDPIHNRHVGETREPPG